MDALASYIFARGATDPPMVFVLLLVQSKGSLGRKLYVLKTFGNLHVFNFMEICAYQTSDKGKGSCNGKRGERWYHCVIRYNVKHFKGW